MLVEMNRNSMYDDLIEPVIQIDLQERKVIYCNKACKELPFVQENGAIEDLINMLASADDYEDICTRIRETQTACTIPNIRLVPIGELTNSYDLKAMYADDEHHYLYMMLQYGQNDIHELFTQNRCFQSIYSISLCYPFRLDVKSKTIYFIGPILSHFKMNPIIYNYPEDVIRSGFIHENDIGAFRRIVDCMYHGKMSDEFFRAYTEEGEILWYQANYVVNQDEYGKPKEVIGEFINVQEKKDLELQLRTDCLTSCLNKSAFEKLVEEELCSNDGKHEYAMIIIDLDNFKVINDNLGHPFGDAVLKEAGHTLNQIFCAGEYLGRIGGDEFMIFMRCEDNMQVLERRAEQVVEAFTKDYQGTTRTYHTTVSMGIAICPKDGTDFDTLYKHADMALYHMKSQGKNGYAFYHSDFVS